MATPDRFISGTVNEAFAHGDELSFATLMAAGFKPIRAGANIRNVVPSDLDRGITFNKANWNGGIYAKRVGRLERGDVLFRFSDSKWCTTLDRQCQGDWWFDLECLLTLRTVSRFANQSFTSTARSQLGILFDWGDMGNLIGGRLTADFWCFRGLSGGYEGTSATGDVQKMSGPMRQDVIQIYVPGGISRLHLDQVHDDVLTSGFVGMA